MKSKNKDDPPYPWLFCKSSMSRKENPDRRKRKTNYYEIAASAVIFAAT